MQVAAAAVVKMGELVEHLEQVVLVVEALDYIMVGLALELQTMELLIPEEELEEEHLAQLYHQEVQALLFYAILLLTQ
tara:strand:- start:52 stop:285 length:234 start_codon:yes stop_codon:yes gene_type:complete